MGYVNVGKMFLMRVEEKTNERGPDYSGRFEVTERLEPGDVVQLSGWVNKAEKTGKPYLRCLGEIREDDDPTARNPAPPRSAPNRATKAVEDDDIPF